MAVRIRVRVPAPDGLSLEADGEVRDSMGLDLTMRRNAVGSWRLAVPLGGRSDDLLHEPQASLDVRDEWGPVFSGPVTSLMEVEDAGGPRLAVEGEDDNGWVGARDALPLPVPATPTPVNLLHSELTAGFNARLLASFPVGGSPLRSLQAISPGPEDMRWGSPGVESASRYDRVTPIQGGATYTVEATVRSPTVSRTANLLVFWLSQPPGHTAVDFPSGVVADSAATVIGADVVLSGVVVAPSDAEAAFVAVDIVGALGGEEHYALVPVLTHAEVTGWAQTEDVRGGLASTALLAFLDVNAGPGADAARRVPGLQTGTDPFVGADGTWRGTGQNLADLAQVIAAEGGVTWQVRSQPGGVLVPEVRLSQRRTGAVFGFGRRNLLAYQLGATRGRNAVYTGGATFPATSTTAPVLVARLEEDAASIAAWGRAEAYLAGPTSLPDELQAAAAANLVSQAGQASVAISPINDGTLRFGRDYFLGDEIGVQTRRGIVWAIAEQVRMTWDADGERVTPTLGAASHRTLAQLVRRVAAAEAALNELEKR